MHFEIDEVLEAGQEAVIVAADRLQGQGIARALTPQHIVAPVIVNFNGSLLYS